VVELKLHSELHVFVPTFLDEVPAYRHFINVKSVLVKIPVVGKIRRKKIDRNNWNKNGSHIYAKLLVA
jgi:hypothetical protein